MRKPLDHWPPPNANDLEKLWQDFLAIWPVERVQAMSLDDYTNGNQKDAFIYWLEFKLSELGSIRGGSAFKFGIFFRANTDPKESGKGRNYSDNYGWSSLYGSTSEVAFANVKAGILKVIKAVQEGALAEIEAINLPEMFKWKLAFLYQDRNAPQLVPIFSLPVLQAISASAEKLPTWQIHQKLAGQKPSGVDIFAYGAELWNRYVSQLRFWKISHGKENFSEEERSQFLASRIAVMHGTTGKGQGKAFIEEMKAGDYFYLCHGNDIGIVLIGKLTSEAEPYSARDEYQKRSYEVIKRLDPPKKYSGPNKAWAPNHNSTCKLVPPNELKLFEQAIMLVHFNFDLANFPPPPEPSKPTNLILYGPPGTGKTYSTVEEAVNIINPAYAAECDRVADHDERQQKYRIRYDQAFKDKIIRFTTFHQSMSYEDFVEGIRPVTSKDGQIAFEIKQGIFKEMCEKAKTDPQDFVLIIDEINRGNVAAILGELITLLEDDKRIGAENKVLVVLPYSREEFGVPQNLHIIGTMNTADRSVEALDTALRRRFTFKEMEPKPGLLPRQVEGIDVQALLETINARVERLLDKDHCIGHSYLMKVKTLDDIKSAFESKILPLLKEYFYGDMAKVGMVLGRRLVEEKPTGKSIFPSNWQPDDIDEREVYRIKSTQDWTVEDIESIYNEPSTSK